MLKTKIFVLKALDLQILSLNWANFSLYAAISVSHVCVCAFGSNFLWVRRSGNGGNKKLLKKPKKKKEEKNITLPFFGRGLVSVLLSALVKRFSAFRMQNFFKFLI